MGWAEALAQRLAFFASPDDATVAATLAALEAAAVDARLLRRFLDACLTLLEEQVAALPELLALCALARAELDGDCDDRALLAREDALVPLARSATLVPARVVFLAAMVAQLPSEQGPAAVMLANDLAAVRRDLPLRALRIALGSYDPAA